MHEVITNVLAILRSLVILCILYDEVPILHLKFLKGFCI